MSADHSQTFEKIIKIIFLAMVWACFAKGYPSGAPSFVCNTMVPGHPATTTYGVPPYAINITTKKTGDEAIVYGTLYSTNQSIFRGFLIEQISTDVGYGDMSSNENSSKTVCGQNNTQGLTHVDSSDKTRVDFTWITMNSSFGDIQFRATVVETCCNVSRFWLNITSNKLEPSTPTPEQSSTSKPASTMPPTRQIKFDPKCGKTKGCYSDCSGSGCTFLVAWQNNNTEWIERANETGTILFDFQMHLPDTNNQWIAVGISPMGKMDGTNVVACLSHSTGVTLQSSYNNGYSNVLFNDTMLGLSLINGDVSDGIIHCQFTREIQIQNETQFLDLEQTFYILVGNGSVINGVIQKHNTDPVASPNKVDFMKNSVEPPLTTITPTVTTPSSSAPNGQILYDSNCGISKGCFPDCQKTECTYLVTWQKNASSNVKAVIADAGDVIFDIKMKIGDTRDKWIAVGISPEGNMKGTNVAACLSQSSGVSLQSSYNGDFSNNLYSDPLFGLNLIESDVSNGIVHCKFSRAKKMTAESEFLDLNNTYYLVVGTGPVVAGVIQQHTSDPYKSENKVDFLKNYVSNEDTSGPPLLIKLHASLMVIAWIFLSSVGIVAARHCKAILADRMYFGVKAWFLVHRGAMMLAVLCVIVAFIAIFVEVKGFSKIAATDDKRYTKSHPYTGIGSTALALINPILAFARPSPTARNRPMFNWVHFIVGNGAHLTAVVTIFFGLELGRAKVHQNALYVMFGYVIIYVIMHNILEIHRRRNKPKSDQEQSTVSYKQFGDEDTDKSSSFKIDDSFQDKSMAEYGGVHRTNSSSPLVSDISVKENTFPFNMLIIHGLLMLLAATCLVLMICLPKQMQQLFDR